MRLVIFSYVVNIYYIITYFFNFAQKLLFVVFRCFNVVSNDVICSSLKGFILMSGFYCFWFLNVLLI